MSSSQVDDFWNEMLGDLKEFYRRFGEVFCPKQGHPSKRG